MNSPQTRGYRRYSSACGPLFDLDLDGLGFGDLLLGMVSTKRPFSKTLDLLFINILRQREGALEAR